MWAAEMSSLLYLAWTKLPCASRPLSPMERDESGKTGSAAPRRVVGERGAQPVRPRLGPPCSGPGRAGARWDWDMGGRRVWASDGHAGSPCSAVPCSLMLFKGKKEVRVGLWCVRVSWTVKFILLLYLFIYLFVCGRAMSLWDLSSPARDQTQALSSYIYTRNMYILM